MTDKMSIGDRMKENYENRSRYMLTRRTPVIIRLDGRAFHTITKHCEKPFDRTLATALDNTAIELCREMQGAKCAYLQSDEISILLTDFDKLDTQAWFDYNLQKIVSISAGIASAIFTKLWCEGKHIATFDCRAFNIPKEEVANYFIWRQKDWTRNSVAMLAQAHFSHKQLYNKTQSDMHDMLHEKGINWADLESIWKNGRFVLAYEGWQSIPAPIFTETRNQIECYLTQKEE